MKRAMRATMPAVAAARRARPTTVRHAMIPRRYRTRLCPTAVRPDPLPPGWRVVGRRRTLAPFEHIFEWRNPMSVLVVPAEVAVWLVNGVPARLVWEGVRYRVTD